MAENYTNAGQQRLLSVLEALVGHELEGVTVAQLQERLGHTTSALYRDLKNLEQKGWAERLQFSGGWRVTPEFAELIRTVQRNLMTIMEKVNNLNRVYVQGESQYGEY